MAIPKTYLTSTKNLKDILTSMQQAQAPKQFSVSFLQNLGYKSSADRLMIGVLKSINFLTANGQPTPRYFEYLDQTQSERVLAEAIREGYSDLFELNVKANEWTREEVKNKLKTLTQGSSATTCSARWQLLSWRLPAKPTSTQSSLLTFHPQMIRCLKAKMPLAPKVKYRCVVR